MGIDVNGKAAWVKSYGHTTGIVTTLDPLEACLFRDYEHMSLVTDDTISYSTLRNVAVQFIHVSNRFID